MSKRVSPNLHLKSFLSGSLLSSSDSKRNTNCLVLVLKLEKVLDVPICVVESVDKDWPLKSLLLTTTFTAGVGLVPVSV